MLSAALNATARRARRANRRAPGREQAAGPRAAAGEDEGGAVTAAGAGSCRGRCCRRRRREAGRARSVSGLDKDGLRALVDQHRGQIKSGVVVLASPSDGKVSIVVGVTPDLTKKVPAGQVVKQLAPIVGGGGGGRPDFAEAGGKDRVEDRRDARREPRRYREDALGLAMRQQHRWPMNPAERRRRAAEACPAGQSCSSLRRFSRHELARSSGP